MSQKGIDKYRGGVYNERRTKYPLGVYAGMRRYAAEDEEMTDRKEMTERNELPEERLFAGPEKADGAVTDDAAPEENVSAEAECIYCGPRHKERSEEDKKTLLTRLRRVEGQIRGIEKMVEGGAYCPDILVQVSAATSALNSFNKELLACHIRCCVAEDIRAGRDETIDELCRVLRKLMK